MHRLRTACAWPLLIAVALVLALVIVNPFREFSPQDDGWAYARSVERLMAHGQYHLDPWSAANMPVQIYLAAGLAEVFGYSFSILRISTLLLLLLSLISFFALLRELRVDRRVATVLTLALLANPLVLMLSFTFMSDIQFLGWLSAALWLYVRGFRKASDLTVFWGSVSAACAIGTRQFGMAFLPALLLPAILSDRASRPPWRRTCISLGMPVVFAIWQLYIGLGAPNVTQVVRLDAQSYYLTRPLYVLGKELAWRVATIWHYLGMMLLGATPLLLPLALANWRRGRGAIIAMLTAAAFLVAFAYLHSSISSRGAADRFLQLWWMLPNAFWEHRWLMRSMDILGLAVAVLLAWLVVADRKIFEWRSTTPGRLVLVGTAATLFALHLVYVQLNDTYIVGLLPFALLIPAFHTRRAVVRSRWLHACAATSLAIVVAQSVWLRGEFNMQEAQWKAADGLLARGVEVACIGGTRHWNEYHGAFDAWLAQTEFGAKSAAPSASNQDPLHDPFYQWMAMRSWRADYQVSSPLESAPPPGWAVYQEIPYRDALLQSRSILVYGRPGSEAAPGCARQDPTPRGSGMREGRPFHQQNREQLQGM